MSAAQGTRVVTTFERVVDGDTIRVLLPAPSGRSEPIRILAIDTEESHAGGAKPVTPWGIKTSAFATQYFHGVREVTLEFPGTEPLEVCLTRYRDNYNRLLAYVYKDEADYQEVLIRGGYSPYFMKYGHAEFAANRARYEQAERLAQREHIGVWNQIKENGSERRNYAALGTWWRLRGERVDQFRRLKAIDPTLLDSRLDYRELLARAQTGSQVTVFSELREVKPTRGGDSSVIHIGSEAQPVSFFIPGSDQGAGREIVNLLLSRYISADEAHPRASYAWVTGRAQLYNGQPEVVLTSPDQISDTVQRRAELPNLQLTIAALLPNPAGADDGAESVTLRNSGSEAVSLEGFRLRDASAMGVPLSGAVGAGSEHTVRLGAGQMPLNNSGDSVLLLDPAGHILHEVRYTQSDARQGREIRFT